LPGVCSARKAIQAARMRYQINVQRHEDQQVSTVCLEGRACLRDV
jgi:hypothetical protein